MLRKLKKEDAKPMFLNWDSDSEVSKYTLWLKKMSKLLKRCKVFVDYLFELGYSKILIRADVRNVTSR